MSTKELTLEQAKKLIMVLKDNGIEEDESITVAEAVCYVTGLDESVLEAL